MIGCIIQARMNSTRLPGKVMMNVDDSNPLLYYVISQLHNSKFIEKMVIATTTNTDDDIIFNYTKNQNVDCFRGNEIDVLDRYYQCAKKYSFSTIVRIPSDKPLIDPFIVDKMIDIFNSNAFDYVTNFLPPTFPSGTEVEIFSFQALEIAWKKAKLPSEREHVTPYFYNNKNKFKIFNYKNKTNLSNIRYAVDRDEDLKLVKLLISRIKKRPILLKDILNQFKINPTLIDINKDVNYYEGYEKSQNEDTEYPNSKN
jgi:spore coat polysaccharide biosynthesis protein SpsF